MKDIETGISPGALAPFVFSSDMWIVAPWDEVYDILHPRKQITKRPPLLCRSSFFPQDLTTARQRNTLMETG